MRASEDDALALDAVSRSAASDPIHASLLIDAARLAKPGPAVRTAKAAVAILGAAGAGRALCRPALEASFSRQSGGAFNLDEFWGHAHICGVFAEQIAEHLGSAYRGEAYAAAVLQDVGRPLLAMMAPEAYGRVLESVYAHGLYLLEAEQAELGVDHALAGKWLAESWGLPQTYVDVIWLHHHAPGVLDAARHPVELIDIAALATHLANRRGSGPMPGAKSPPWLDVRLERLGIRPDEFDTWTEWPIDDSPALLFPGVTARAAEDMAPPAIPVQDDSEKRYEALLRLVNAAAPGADLGDVLDCVAEAVRGAFDIYAGLCYVVLPGESRIEARLWRGLSSPLDSHRTNLAEGDEGATLGGGALGLLIARLGGHSASVSHQGLMTVPLAARGDCHGQLVLDMAASGLTLDRHVITELYGFAEACGGVVAQSKAFEVLSGQSESLSTSLWQQELTFQRKLRAERLAGVGQLAAGAAHEINNPLAVISGRAQILLSRAEREEDVRALETIVQQSRRVTAILTDLMQFARPSQPRFESTMISYILHQVASSLRDRLEKKGIRIVEEYAQGLPRLRLDPHQMQQVFLNLIVNAEQAMAKPHGADGRVGGVLTLRVRASAERRTCIIQVADTGPGIPASIVDQIFDPFFTTKNVGEGTGLGLSVCHGIVEAHQGGITVNSTVGSGTTFTITLPHVTAQTGDVLGSVVENFEPTGQTAAAPQKPAVIVAERDEDLAGILAQTLGQRGYRVRTAGDGLEALAVLVSEGAEMLIMDATLTGLEGAPLFQQVRDRFPGVPILVLAGPVSEEEAAQFRRRGARACLRKPFEMARLLIEVQQAMVSRNVA